MTPNCSPYRSNAPGPGHKTDLKGGREGSQGDIVRICTVKAADLKINFYQAPSV